VAKKTPETNRRKIIEEQRKKARATERRKTVLTIVISTLVGAALIGGSVYFSVQSKDKGPNTALRNIGAQSADAGCLEPKAEDVPKDATDDAVKHTAKNGDRVEYTSHPPTSGRHNPTPLPVGAKKFYSRGDNPPPERAVHNLEHGYVVVWYDMKVSDADIELLKNAADAAEGKFVIVPWQREDFPDDKHIVLTAWSERQQCGQVSGDAMQKFMDTYGGTHGKAPEKNAI
jgi:hypothetical protein